GRGRGACPSRGRAGARGGAARGGRGAGRGGRRAAAARARAGARRGRGRRPGVGGRRGRGTTSDGDARRGRHARVPRRDVADVREGMSVAMAWDGARAVELLGAQRPEMVVIDLALPGRVGYALVARLAACDPPPVLALIPGDDDAPAAFAAALAEEAHAVRMLPLADLLVRVLGLA